MPARDRIYYGINMRHSCHVYQGHCEQRGWLHNSVERMEQGSNRQIEWENWTEDPKNKHFVVHVAPEFPDVASKVEPSPSSVICERAVAPTLLGLELANHTYEAGLSFDKVDELTHPPAVREYYSFQGESLHSTSREGVQGGYKVSKISCILTCLTASLEVCCGRLCFRSVNERSSGFDLIDSHVD